MFISYFGLLQRFLKRGNRSKIILYYFLSMNLFKHFKILDLLCQELWSVISWEKSNAFFISVATLQVQLLRHMNMIIIYLALAVAAAYWHFVYQILFIHLYHRIEVKTLAIVNIVSTVYIFITKFIMTWNPPHVGVENDPPQGLIWICELFSVVQPFVGEAYLYWGVIVILIILVIGTSLYWAWT